MGSRQGRARGRPRVPLPAGTIPFLVGAGVLLASGVFVLLVGFVQPITRGVGPSRDALQSAAACLGSAGFVAILAGVRARRSRAGVAGAALLSFAALGSCAVSYVLAGRPFLAADGFDGIALPESERRPRAERWGGLGPEVRIHADGTVVGLDGAPTIAKGIPDLLYANGLVGSPGRTEWLDWLPVRADRDAPFSAVSSVLRALEKSPSSVGVAVFAVTRGESELAHGWPMSVRRVRSKVLVPASHVVRAFRTAESSVEYGYEQPSGDYTGAPDLDRLEALLSESVDFERHGIELTVAGDVAWGQVVELVDRIATASGGRIRPYPTLHLALAHAGRSR